MQVSGVLTSKFTVFGNNDAEAKSVEDSKYSNNTFTSSSQGIDSSSEMFKNINEWKEFCHKQILNGNIDFMA